MYIPTHLHSYGSFDCVSRPKDIIAKAKLFNMPAIALTDHGTLGASAEFYQEARKAGIKPLLGIEAYICNEHSSIKEATNRSCNHLVILAKNLQGWKSLLKIVAKSNSESSFYYKPRISLEEIGELNASQNLIAISGHPGSTLGAALWLDESSAFNANSYEEAKTCADSVNWSERLSQCIYRHLDVFGKENFFVEIQRMDEDRLFMAQILNKALRAIATKLRLRSVATNDPHYVNREDAVLQRILLAGRMKTTLGRINDKLKNAEDVGMGGFFKSDNYYILSPAEMSKLHTESELKASLEIANICEDYKIEAPPQCPSFPDVPDGMSKTDYLRQLCAEGYRKIYKGKVDDSIYGTQIIKELKLFQEAKIEDYFLITQDILKSLRKRNKLHGPGRGCLIGSSPILVDNTVKRLDEIQIGDKVYTINGTLQTVENLFEYECNEELINIKCYYGDFEGISLTTDHQVYGESVEKIHYPQHWNPKTIAKAKKFKKPLGHSKWMRADETKAGDYLFIPRIKLKNLSIVFDLADFSDDKHLKHDNEFVYQYKSGNQFGEANTLRLPRYITIDKEWVMVFGYFVGNGWINSNENSYLGFAFHSEHSDKINWLKNFAHRIGVPVSERLHDETKLVQLELRSKHLKLLFKKLHDKYSHTAQTKHVPDFIFNMSEANILEYIKGAILADGSEDISNFKYSTSSYCLSHQIRKLCWMVGMPASRGIDDRIDLREKFKNRSVTYYIKIPKNEKLGYASKKRNVYYFTTNKGIFLRIRSVKKIKSPGKVYDIQVSNNHNYLTSSFLVHNSIGGSLVASCLGITINIDPIKHNLLFERFINPDRVLKGEFPDIDIDVPQDERENVLEYIINKYGKDNVCQVATFGQYKGKSALKLVMKALDVPFVMQNEITKYIPDEQKITDDIVEFAEEHDGQKSILLMILEEEYRKSNPKLKEAKELDRYVRIANGQLTGDFAEHFELAARMEYVRSHQGKHAAAVLISKDPLVNSIPLVKESNGSNLICGWSFPEAEWAGILKWDILGLAALDCLQIIAERLYSKGLL